MNRRIMRAFGSRPLPSACSIDVAMRAAFRRSLGFGQAPTSHVLGTSGTHTGARVVLDDEGVGVVVTGVPVVVGAAVLDVTVVLVVGVVVLELAVLVEVLVVVLVVTTALSRQRSLHPSPGSRLPSSQSSAGLTTPSPHGESAQSSSPTRPSSAWKKSVPPTSAGDSG